MTTPNRNRKQISTAVDVTIYENFKALANETRIPSTKLLDEALEDLLVKHGKNNGTNSNSGFIPMLSSGGNSHEVSQEERSIFMNAVEHEDDKIMELRGQIITLVQRAPLDIQTGEIVLRMLRGLFYNEEKYGR